MRDEPNATFDHPVTFNIYAVDKSVSPPKPGALLATVTDTFTMPYRPAADPTCATPSQWKDADGVCNNGIAFTISFDFSSLNVQLPDEVIYGIAYNTNTHGYAPLNAAGPYEALNVGARTFGPYAGTDISSDSLYWNTKVSSWYFDGGALGSSIFRYDENWTTYQPNVTFEMKPAAIPSAALYIPSAKIKLDTGATTFTVPVMFRSYPVDLASVAFSIDYDQTCLTMAAAPALASGYTAESLITLDNNDATGELDAGIWDANAMKLADGKLFDMTFSIKPGCTADFIAPVLIGNVPPLSCGTTVGQSFDCTGISAYIPVDFNADPTDIAPNSFTIAENVAASSVVGNFTATDPDGDTPLTFSLDGGTDDAAFTLSPAGELKINASPNFESQSAYSIKVKVVDGRGGSYSETIAINITNVNEPPTDITLTGNTVAENAPNATVGTLSDSDVDGPTDAYTLAADPVASCGAGSYDNAQFAIDGTSLKVGATGLDYETPASHTRSVCISVSDGEFSFAKAFTVNVTNVNEAPLTFNLSNNIVSVEQVPNFVIGTLSVASDPDGGTINQGDYTYTEVAGGTGDTTSRLWAARCRCSPCQG